MNFALIIPIMYNFICTYVCNTAVLYGFNP
jgi:hypothetical protein